MPRTDTNQTWDVDGNLVHEETVEVPDPEPTVEERLVEVEERLNNAPSAADLDELKQRLGGK